ncbi:7-deoxyloganetin glucosyltransferase-like [Camellia sinensis]|uniref:7-deoxyloganetin glucosyltransferase-like n=1 Tax=Camellia sinensis TaxID=4442 RepID=UPI0010362DC4|nr:7-deoxyloganetin glucosyltransferase-like [Camellia sinensis]
MGSQRSTEKPSPPHAVCIPFPAQGHINPMLKLAKLLNHKGFHITFINTEFNHRHLLKSRGPNSLAGTPSFRFETIPDGLPSTDNAPDATQDVPSLCDSTRKNCLVPFRDLIAKINHTASSKVPPVSCIVSDGIMSFTVLVAQELGIPDVLFWTTSACGFMGYVQYRQLIEKDLTPLKGITFSKQYESIVKLNNTNP